MGRSALVLGEFFSSFDSFTGWQRRADKIVSLLSTFPVDWNTNVCNFYGFVTTVVDLSINTFFCCVLASEFRVVFIVTAWRVTVVSDDGFFVVRQGTVSMYMWSILGDDVVVVVIFIRKYLIHELGELLESIHRISSTMNVLPVRRNCRAITKTIISTGMGRSVFNCSCLFFTAGRRYVYERFVKRSNPHVIDFDRGNLYPVPGGFVVGEQHQVRRRVDFVVPRGLLRFLGAAHYDHRGRRIRFVSREQVFLGPGFPDALQDAAERQNGSAYQHPQHDVPPGAVVWEGRCERLDSGLGFQLWRFVRRGGFCNGISIFKWAKKCNVWVNQTPSEMLIWKMSYSSRCT